VKRIGLVVICTLLLLLRASNVAGNVGIDSGTNAHRTSAGLVTLSTNATLQAMAAQRAQEIVQPNFVHDTPLLVSRVESHFACWTLVGENIAYRTTPTTDATYVQMCCDTPEHRANMMKAAFRLQGSATYAAPDGLTYAVQIFLATCESPAPAPSPTSKPKPASSPEPTHAPAPTPAPTFRLPNTSVVTWQTVTTPN
jgi:hypothetical protein